MSDVNFRRLTKEMSGRGGAGGSAILFTIIALVSAAVFWASWAELDNVTRGEGKVISSVQNQLVQASEGGVILRRLVSENSIVEAGEILFELDPVDASSELNRLNQRLLSLEIKEIRLQAEIAGLELHFPKDMEANSPLVALTEANLFAARRSELEGTLAVTTQQLQQRKQDLSVAELSAQTAQKTVGYLEEEVILVQPLVKDGILPMTRQLELQRALEQAKGDLNRALGSIEQAKSGILELEMQIGNIRENYKLRAYDELNTVVIEKAELSEAIPRLEERVSRTIIKAPMDGIVSQLNYRTEGGFVNTGDVVLELVPSGEALMIEGRIAPQDISQIRVDDTALIRLSAYDSAKYGTIDGRVTRISPDAVADNSTQGSSFYIIDVAIESDLFIEGSRDPVALIPGMTATIDVLSGKRTVLEYFWQPIARIQELALCD